MINTQLQTIPDTAIVHKPEILLCIIQDMSGSMQPVRQQTIEGFNEYVATLQRDGRADYRLTVVQFNTGVFDANKFDDVSAVVGS